MHEREEVWKKDKHDDGHHINSLLAPGPGRATQPEVNEYSVLNARLFCA